MKALIETNIFICSWVSNLKKPVWFIHLYDVKCDSLYTTPHLRYCIINLVGCNFASLHTLPGHWQTYVTLATVRFTSERNEWLATKGLVTDMQQVGLSRVLNFSHHVLQTANETKSLLTKPSQPPSSPEGAQSNAAAISCHSFSCLIASNTTVLTKNPVWTFRRCLSFDKTQISR